MAQVKISYGERSKEELIKIIEHLEQQLIIESGIKRQYMKHLEEVIQFRSIEDYRQTVQKNKETA
ncbi:MULTISPECIES: hypothetical protein [Lactococcus]|uniref:hypothetical protein n=1 Tax=Lactococcus TaxID=1357 RepID=UPI000EC2B5B6|nr:MULTISPECIES: hypothetical protein [Lactococcus]HAP15105.1 hypothetical protein [Lactococcus sp.]